ncbi:zinc-dependent metalloprotease [Actinophytocola gossypii]|uniref:Zinc-dependent metalloprotease n=1 Tax=Actinophytocola gossypii TaxID=2812003 RepID=A0ABT2J3V8_9PSEU|nr:zinc-dependent metalloprotease [Actinophytocola gossypii]MCT2582530.1 zinc-dependent metalloprotease [Actinophytocola gossypii]
MSAAAESEESTVPNTPVDWGIAVATAHRLIKPGPVVPKEEAERTVGQLREVTGVAEAHVRELTGLGADLPLLPGDVVDRRGWVTAAAEGLEALTDGALPAAGQGRAIGGVLAGSAGVQAGMVLAYLGGRVLGQYDPFGGDENGGRLLLVAPNIVAAQRALDVPGEDFRMWVCLHECTHRLQFTAVPWLRDYFAGEVRRFLTDLDDSASGAFNRLPEMIRTMRRRPDDDTTSSSGPIGLVEMLQTPQQREVFDRLIALSTLLEGHADHVMDAVGPSVVPSVATIRARFTARRRGGGMLDRVLRTVLGVDAKVKQYAVGASFTRHVVDAVGMTGFNAIWTSPDTLPLRAELGDPAAWVRRVHP